jgi:hypothetical protein
MCLPKTRVFDKNDGQKLIVTKNYSSLFFVSNIYVEFYDNDERRTRQMSQNDSPWAGPRLERIQEFVHFLIVGDW